MLTDGEIETLIHCPKTITSAPKKEMLLSLGCLRNEMNLQSVDGKSKFHAFMRINNKFNENFTIGLDYIFEGTNICLLRCNGKHGEHTNNELSDNHHFHYHIHIAKAEYIAKGFKSEKYAEITEDYSTYQDALDYFLTFCNIINKDKYFMGHERASITGKQITLFDLIKDDKDE